MGKFNLWSVTSLWSQLIQNIQETTEDGAILACKLFSVFWGLDCWHSTQWDHHSFNSSETHLKSALPMRRYSVFSKLLTKPNDKREVSQSGHCFFDTAQYRFKGNWSINPPHITNIGCFCIVFIKQPKGKKEMVNRMMTDFVEIRNILVKYISNAKILPKLCSSNRGTTEILLS